MLKNYKEKMMEGVSEPEVFPYLPFATIVASVFLSDGFAMLLLSFSSPGPFYLYGLVHASIMTVMVSPLLYLLLLRPMSLNMEERRKAEDVLRKMSNAVEQSADLVVITDKKGIIEYVNPAFERLTGYTREEVVGKTSRILKSGFHDRGFYKQMWETILAGKVFRAEFVNMKKNRELYYEKKSIAPIMDADGSLTHFVSTGKDVTEQRLVEVEKEKVQAQYYHAQKMEAIGTLAGGIAHDFNNLMTAVQGFSTLGLEAVDRDSAVHKYFHQIHSASCRASDLAGQLLVFSRKQPMELKPINTNATIESIMKMITRLIGENISVELNLEPDPWTMIADEGKIVQIIMNLAVNAKDAMPEGGKLLIATRNTIMDAEYCKSVPDARPGKYICLTVSDSGTGIGKDVLQRIFEPFFTTKEVGRGTGLGLSVIYGIVKEHEGWIKVYSKPGVGTTFKIYLPAMPIKADDVINEAIRVKAHRGSGKRVLLIEDENHVLEFASAALRDSGYAVFPAGSAEEAMDIFQTEKGMFDVIFSDVVLPGKTGVQFADELSDCGSNIKVILTSGYTDLKSHLKESLESRYMFLQKPYTLRDLLEVLRNVAEAA